MQSCTARAFVGNTSTAFALLGSGTAQHSIHMMCLCQQQPNRL